LTTPAYCTAEAFDDYISDEFASTEATLRLGALNAAERAINEYCNRSFPVAGSATAKLYVPSNTPILRIHDCTTVTAVTESGTAVTTYQKEPVAAAWSGLAKPYEQLLMLGSYWSQTGDAGEATISVTATWGWAAVPDEVSEATKILGKDILQQRRTSGNLIAVGDFGGSVRINTYVKQLLNPLRRVEAFGIA